MPVSSGDELLQQAIQRLIQLRVRIQLGEVSREAGPALLHEIEAELRRLGVSDQRLPVILREVEEAATAIASARMAEVESQLGAMVNPPAPNKRAELSQILHETERAANVRLTGAGRDVLRIPTLEVYELTDEWNPQQLRNSVASILQSVRDSELTDLDRQAHKRTSISVLRAIHTKWCSIPPFCSRVDRGR